MRDHGRPCGLPTLVCVFSLNACGGASAATFRPGQVPRTDGAVMGRVQVFKGESEVTSACYISFTDQWDEPTGQQYSLDRSGWVFMSLPQGTTYLSYVNCVVWNGLTYWTRALHFDVAGQGRTTYFGHVRFHLANRDLEITLGAAASGLATVPVTTVAGAAITSSIALSTSSAAAAIEEGENRVIVQDISAEAVRAYAQRYAVAPQLVTSLALQPRVKEREPTFVTRGEVMSAAVDLGALQLTWLGLARAEKPWLGFRVWHRVQKAELENCRDVALVLDQERQNFSATYEAKPVGTGLLESVGAKVDVETFQAMGSARHVELELCGKRYTVPLERAKIAAEIATAYESALAALPQRVHAEPSPSAEARPAPAATEQATTQEDVSLPSKDAPATSAVASPDVP